MKILKKMYPLLPLQLFNLRKTLNTAKKKNDDINTIKETICSGSKHLLATKLANEFKRII